jgi:hypothetical protein
MLGPVSAKNDDEKRKFVFQGNDIIHKTMEIVQQKSCVDDHCRPEIANNYFRPLINLICYASDIAEIEGKFLDAAIFNITLLKLGIIISDMGDEEDYYCRTTCFYFATKRLFRLIEDLNSTQCFFLIEEIKKLLERLSPLESRELFEERINKKEKERGLVAMIEKRMKRFEFEKQLTTKGYVK